MSGFGNYPTVLNKTMTVANTEYSQALPTGTRKFTVSCVDGTAMRIAFVTGKVATPTAPYYAILANQSYESPDLDGNAALTVYGGGGGTGKIMQIIAWQ